VADDAGTVERLQAQLRQAWVEIAALRGEKSVLVRESERHAHAITEALEQQAALAEVLRVIASSPTDVQRVLDAIVVAANRLCESAGAAILRLRARDRRLAACALVGAVPSLIAGQLPSMT
jgi:hypothetical protein